MDTEVEEYMNNNLDENKQHNTNMNKKQVIRLTESDLHRIVKESVNKILNEVGETPQGQYMLGRLAARQKYRRGHETGENNGYGYLCGGEDERYTDEYARQKRQTPNSGYIGDPYKSSEHVRGYHDEESRQKQLYGLK